jgi:GTPase SAR1 family protein
MKHLVPQVEKVHGAVMKRIACEADNGDQSGILCAFFRDPPFAQARSFLIPTTGLSNLPRSKQSVMPFAQLVVGPPGSGKSTYCNGMHQFMSAIGRKSSVVNLDPANDQIPYPCALDIRDLVTLEDIMLNDELGPNGSVLYALEELEQNMDWLAAGLKELGDDYILFDCPGQVELFTHHDSLRKIFFQIQKLGYRVCFCPCLSTQLTGLTYYSS